MTFYLSQIPFKSQNTKINKWAITLKKKVHSESEFDIESNKRSLWSRIPSKNDQKWLFGDMTLNSALKKVQSFE